MTISSMVGLSKPSPFVVGDLSSPIGTKEAATMQSGDVGDEVTDGQFFIFFSHFFICLYVLSQAIGSLAGAGSWNGAMAALNRQS